jgi:hypothetical protein
MANPDRDLDGLTRKATASRFPFAFNALKKPRREKIKPANG